VALPSQLTLPVQVADSASPTVETVNGQVFGEKPILYYWLARAGSAAAGGVTEGTLRLPSVLAGIAIVLLTWLLVVPYAGRRRGGLAALLAATTFGIFWNARFVQMDILVTATTLGTIVAVSAPTGKRTARRVTTLTRFYAFHRPADCLVAAVGVRRSAPPPGPVVYPAAASKRALTAPQSTTFQIASRYSGRRFWYLR